MKKILTFILAIILLISPVYALPTGTDRKNMDNYGVNKKTKMDSSNLDNILRTPYVDPSKKIYDYGEILTSEEKEELFRLIGNYIEHTKMDMVILTIDLPNNTEYENEEYATDFYDYNDFGLDLDYYSGVLLYRNKNENPYYGVYTFGEAQLYYDDDRLDIILDGVYSYFSTSNYLEGFKYLINELTNYYNRGKSLTDYYVDDMGYIHQYYKMPIGLSLIGGGVVSLITILVMVKKNKMVKKATEANDYVDKSSIVFNTRSDILTGSFTTHHTISHDSGGHGGGGHSSHSGSSGRGHGGGGRRG